MIKRYDGPPVSETMDAVAEIQRRAHAPLGMRPWAPAEIGALIGNAATDLLVAADGEPQGFLLGSAVAGEAEILSLAVDPVWQGRGIGGRLVDAYKRRCVDLGITRMILEVAETNSAAIGFYGSSGFSIIATRPDYYDLKDRRVAALVMECDPATINRYRKC